MPVQAERTERANEQHMAVPAPTGLESARNATYGPGAQATPSRAGEQSYTAQGSEQQMLVGHIDFNDFGQIFTSTFDTALDKQEKAMVAAAFTGTALGVSDVVLGAAKSTLLASDIAQDLYSAYFVDNSQTDYSQKLVQDIEKINIRPALQVMHHVEDVARQHEQGQAGSGFLQFDTYEQLAKETATVAGAAVDAVAKLDPATQIETGLRLNSALLFAGVTGRAASVVKDAVSELNIADKARNLFNDAKEGLAELTTQKALTSDGRLLKIPESPEVENNILRMTGRAREHGFTKNLNGLDVTDRLRCELPASIDHTQNVAFSDVAINGVKGRLVAVSGEEEIAGTVNIPKAYTLGEAENLTIGCQTRDSDTEFKILEEVVRKYDLVKLEELARREGGHVSGEIYMFTEKQPCGSCEKVIKQFRQDYPGITLVGEFAHVK